MTDFRELMISADAVVVDALGDKTVTIKRNAAAIATDIKVIFDQEMQDIDSNGLVQGLRPGFTINKADLSTDTLRERDEIIDASKTWRVVRPLYEDESIVTVMVV
jgi:hypothetical protein